MTMDTGLARLSGLPLTLVESIAIAGEGVVDVAAAISAAGGPPLVVESDHFALLSRSDEVQVAGRVRDLAPTSVDIVVLRRAWRDPREVGEAIRIAHDRVVPGGEVIAADLDVQKLLAGPTPRYPGRLFYLASSDAADGLRASTASPAMLAADAVRAGLKPIDMLTYDDVRSTHDDVADLWNAIRERGWRGAAWTPVGLQSTVVDAVADAMASAVPAGPAVDREPWFAIIGTRA
jgi:hypothetical protein